MDKLWTKIKRFEIKRWFNQHLINKLKIKNILKYDVPNFWNIIVIRSKKW